MSNAADEGSTSGEKTQRRAVSFAGFSAASARSAASFTSRSTSAAICSSSSCRRQALGEQAPLEEANRVAHRLGLALRRRSVQPLVVGQRVRVGPDDLGVDQRRPAPLARVRHRLLQDALALREVGAVDRQQQQVGERHDNLGEVAARRLDFTRDGDGVAVVLDEIHDGQSLAARRVQRFPELAFGGGALARRHVDHLVRVVARLAIRDVGEALIEAAGLGAADRLQVLRARRAALRHDVQALVPPVRRHLTAAGCRIVPGADRLEQHLVGRDAQRQAQGPVAVVGEEPVVRRPKCGRRRHQHRLVPGSADLEEDPALVLQLDLPVIQLAGQDHPAPRVGHRGCMHGTTRQ